MTRSSLLQHLLSLSLPLKWFSGDRMSDYPDYSPPPNLAYPPSPSNYVNLGTNVFLNSTSPTTLHNFTDGKLYLLKYFAFNGSIVDTSSSTSTALGITMTLTQGLTNNGIPSIITGARGWVQSTVVSNPREIQWVFAEVPGPLIFQSGSVGTPNALTLTADVGSASLFFEGVVYGLCWPLN